MTQFVVIMIKLNRIDKHSHLIHFELGVTLVNSLRPGQDGSHFPDDTFKCIFLNEYVYISIKISLKFDPNGPINNIPALV